MKNDAYIVPSVNYCDGPGRRFRCFRFVCIYAVAAVFLCATVFSVNKDLYLYHVTPVLQRLQLSVPKRGAGLQAVGARPSHILPEAPVVQVTKWVDLDADVYCRTRVVRSRHSAWHQ